MRFKITLQILLGIAVTQCKPAAPQGSSGKTLSNVVAKDGTQRDQLCGFAYEGRGALPPNIMTIQDSIAITPEGDSPFRSAVIGTLAAVPTSLLKLYFTILHGQIVIGDAQSQCRSAPFANSERPLVGNAEATSCWLSPSGSQPLRMVVMADVTKIRSSLLRLFAYWEAEYFIPGLRAPNVPAYFSTPEWKAYADAFITERGKIAASFLLDLKTMQGIDASKLNTFSSTDPNAFGNFIYANAVDSYYCSSVTRSEFMNQFRSTWNAFTDTGSKYATAKELGEPSSWF